MTVLVTGAAGFIGSHMTRALLDRGRTVLGVDNLNSYYDPALKRARLARLEGVPGFRFQALELGDTGAVAALFRAHPEIEQVLHLAAQAGVRYSLTHPFSYVESNVTGHLAVLEGAKALPRLSHLVYASSSSVYGANEKQPFSEADRVDTPVSVYAATKRAGELLSETYARLFGIPQTGLRFFTVYGPWGRPDMAYWGFTEKILSGQPIELFNGGDMRRDFTYIDDVVGAVLAALDRPPGAEAPPHRVYNIGNERPEPLRRFLEVLERHCGRPARIVEKPMQPGEVKETFADIAAARRDLGFEPATTIDEGLGRFVAWFREWRGL
ncbi:UDP-glucuronate 4-epimerase [Tistlia consotensis]|uniref:UDP-glucuronate 4-epimerase n=1 Tax=Tistlia consotensis USBA 355 TaxID=560819 RepID=A0A1Y6CAQ9_9PROT|nr:NAD-dependent epimerase/dehydratase family protein [Tistlia consotensis]SMF45811.1 UDP-glucuronate 4-epimerase [Tistlia consotensis USBA 355]SNR79253.1 UDP-glucuronate 4-epimerase [Tistlia consotensis]